VSRVVGYCYCNLKLMTEMECNISVIYKVYLVGFRKSTAD